MYVSGFSSFAILGHVQVYFMLSKCNNPRTSEQCKKTGSEPFGNVSVVVKSTHGFVCRNRLQCLLRIFYVTAESNGSTTILTS